jgi:hypothetical protein
MCLRDEIDPNTSIIVIAKSPKPNSDVVLINPKSLVLLSTHFSNVCTRLPFTSLPKFPPFCFMIFRQHCFSRLSNHSCFFFTVVLFKARIKEINPLTANPSPKIMQIEEAGCPSVVVTANPNKSQPPIIAPVEMITCSFFVML